MDMVMDALAVLGRDRQHTGIINTQGGDAFDLGNAGDGGKLAILENAALVESYSRNYCADRMAAE